MVRVGCPDCVSRTDLISADRQPEPEPEHDRQQDTITTRISRPLVNLVNKVEVLIPSGGIVLRASALAVVLVSAVGLALFSFFWLWTSVSVPDSQYENVWLQYG